MLKTCCKCGQQLSLSEFHKNAERKDGLTETCKVCACAAARAWRKTNLKRARENGLKYAREHRGQARTRASRWYREHRAYTLERNRKFRIAHLEEIREKDRARTKTEQARLVKKAHRKTHSAKVREQKRRFYQNHKAEILKKQRAYTARNRERIRLRNALWKKKNPGRAREIQNRYDRRRRASIAGVLCTLTREQWEGLLCVFGNSCAYCGREGLRLEQEHVIPLSRGGHTTADNIVPACRSCNASKGDKLLGEWLH